MKILGNVNTSIDILSLKDVDLVTSDIIRKAVEQVKANKNDPVFTFNSDCIKRAPATLFQHLANIIRIFLIHGYVSKILLVATIVPLIKDKLVHLCGICFLLPSKNLRKPGTRLIG